MNYPNHMKAWSDADKQKLVDMFIDGHGWVYISKELGRTEFAIKSKLYQIHNSPKGAIEQALLEELDTYINNYESTGKYAGRLVGSNVEEKEGPSLNSIVREYLGKYFFNKSHNQVARKLFQVSSVALASETVYVKHNDMDYYTPIENCDFVTEIVHLD